MTVTEPVALTADDVAERILASGLGALETLSIHLGDRLGWYRALAEHGPATPAELVERAGGDERYAREWLEQQAVNGLLGVAEAHGDRRFVLGPAEAEALTDTSSLAYLAPLARMIAGAAVQMPALLEAYRTGSGVAWSQFGADARESQADMNRPWFEHELAPALSGVAHIDETLRRPGARIADIGCGGGWSTIALAHAYRQATLTGYDVDPPSIELARRNAEFSAVADRVRFHLVDAATVAEDDGFDAVFAFECIHDLPHPVEALSAAHRMVRDDGVVIVMDEAVAEHFAAPGDDLEKLMYGFSLFICLPDGRAHDHSAATGTVMRPKTLLSYATQAGFRDVDVLPISDFGFWRFYQLRQ